MKHLYPVVTILISIFFQLNVLAQNHLETAKNYFQNKYPDLEKAHLNEWMITDEVKSEHNGLTHLYLRQVFEGIEIVNSNINLTFKNGKAIHSIGKVITKLNTTASKSSSLSPEQAVQEAARQLNLRITEPLSLLQQAKAGQILLSKGGISIEPIPVKQVFWVDEKNNLKLCWDLSIYELNQENWWSIRIDAQSGEIFEKNNWVTKCKFDNDNHIHDSSCETNTYTGNGIQNTALAGEQYKVFALPLESPNHGAESLVLSPSDPTASPFGWHDTNGANGAEYTITRGNNVHAYEDRDNKNIAGYSPNGGNELKFDFNFNLNGGRNDFLDVSITNLFYWNNIIHDVFYKYGFNEQAGNFQNNNYGKGGIGNDEVRAEAQDGSGFNNANFATPADGSKPRMQMYLWGERKLLTINSPSAIAGKYTAVQANFGPALSQTLITGDLIIASDGSANPSQACNTITNSVSGKIAVIDRGNCNFVAKIRNAQNAGAIAVIVINNVAGSPTTMGLPNDDNGADITIPSVMISLDNGNMIKNQLNNNTVVNISLSDNINEPGFRDSSFDNGIITHEYGHGISNRLTGGPSNSNCLSNAEQMGEGWSDYFALMLTMKEGDTSDKSRGVGTFSINQAITGNGIRPAPYTTNQNINGFTYDDIKNRNTISVPHGIGFIWCTMLWDMTWAFVDKYGFDPDIKNGTGGNNIALQLVIDGLKLQPCNPGFVDGRDAILLADQINNNGANQALIWAAFSKRGLGASAKQGNSNDLDDGTEAFDIPSDLSIDLKVDSTFAKISSELKYTILVKNTSNKHISNIVVEDNLPSGLSFVDGSANNENSIVQNKITFGNISLNANEEKNISFKAKINNQPTTAVRFTDDHEKGSDKWLVNKISGSNVWELQNSKSYSGAFSWLVYNISTASEMTLTMKNPIQVANTTMLSFYHRYQTEKKFDGGVIEISTDTGKTWASLSDKMVLNPYNDVIDVSSGTSLADKNAFTGTSDGFIKTIVNLGSFSGKNILIRFRFVTDEGTADDGWYIDDFYIYDGNEQVIKNEVCTKIGNVLQSCKDVKTVIVASELLITGLESLSHSPFIRLYPNPNNGLIHLEVTNKQPEILFLTFYNSTGAKIKEEKVNLTDQIYELNMEALSDGIYFLKIQSKDKSYFQKIIKR